MPNTSLRRCGAQLLNHLKRNGWLPQIISFCGERGNKNISLVGFEVLSYLMRGFPLSRFQIKSNIFSWVLYGYVSDLFEGHYKVFFKE